MLAPQAHFRICCATALLFWKHSMLKHRCCQNQSTLWWSLVDFNFLVSCSLNFFAYQCASVLCKSPLRESAQLFSVAVQLQKSQVLSSLKLCHACLWRWLAIPRSLCYVIIFEIFFWWPRWRICQIDTWQLQSDWLIEHAPSYANAIHGPVTVTVTVRAAGRKAFITWKVHGWTASENSSTVVI